ncbi:hypothetical protein [Streptomyces alboniger]|uniref:Lipoprotein n=1 Tax=Streptomyces alboniger TaxID=132473 RepID=A0A5J6HPU3_STRAD|nr:hypothetical protein [Streptomyces alboniger]QEV22349.1 hypothetical protein CP975_15085 [Streptomyces alboniger]
MVTSPTHRRRLRAAALLLAAAAPLTACGSETRAGSASDAPRDDTSPQASRSPSAPSPSAPSPSAPGASPYVEPGVVDGAPHNGENNAYRRPGEMSSADKKAALAEAARIKPVLKRLWQQKEWDPDQVRAALTGELGYEVRETTSGGELLGGELDVREMYERYEEGGNVTPEGAMIGLYVGDDACVTAFVQKTNYEVRATGRFMETGCIEPPTGH